MSVRSVMQRWGNTTVNNSYIDGTLSIGFLLSRACWTVDGHTVNLTVHDTTNQLAASAGQAEITMVDVPTPGFPRLQVRYKGSAVNGQPAPAFTAPGFLYDTVTYPPPPFPFALKSNALVFADLATVSNAKAVAPVANAWTKVRTDTFVVWIRLTIVRDAANAAMASRPNNARVVIADVDGQIPTAMVPLPFISDDASAGTIVHIAPVVIPAKPIPGGGGAMTIAYVEGANAVANPWGGGGGSMTVAYYVGDGQL